MTLAEAVSGLPPEQRVKVGATRGTCYFYIGKASELLDVLMSFGRSELRLRPVDEVRPADAAADPEAMIIMVQGTDRGRYWATDESPWSQMAFGWGWM